MAWPVVEQPLWYEGSSFGAELPRISVITPSFNQGKYIESTIRSVLGQKYPNIQYIVVDNCSTDNTSGVLERFRENIDHLVVEKDTGQSNALNKGLALADGDLITWINSDDMLAPGALFQVANAYLTHGAPDLIAGSLLYMVGEEILYEHITAARSGPLDLDMLLDVHNQWMQGRFFYQPEVFFSRAAFQRAGGHIDENLHYSMDYDLWLRLAATGARMEVIGVPLAIFRGHPEQKTSSPAKYMPELLRHATVTGERYGRAGGILAAKPLKPNLRLLFVCDVPEGGASLAHFRLASIAKDAGHVAEIVYLLDHWTAGRLHANIDSLYSRALEFSADLVIIGNLHGAGNAVSIMEMLTINFRCAFYAHDMWLITGRCTYTKGCTKLLTGCDEKCPTAHEYPDAPRTEVSRLHNQKLKLQSMMDLSVFANSTWMKDRVDSVWRSHGIDGHHHRNISVVHPPCDVGVFLKQGRHEARTRLGLCLSKDILVCSANNFADARKGFRYIVDAIRCLSNAEIKPLVIIMGWAEDDIKSKLSEHSNVCFLGHIDPHLAPVIYGAADILLSAALDEAFGMVYVEAAAAGAQSVAFRMGGVEDAVCNGVSGVLVDSLSGEALADAVTGILTRKRAGEDISSKPRLWASANHSDIAALRQLFFAATDQAGIRQSAPPRTQLHRRTTLLNLVSHDQIVDPLLGLVCEHRTIYVAGQGTLNYSLRPECAEFAYRVLHFELTIGVAGPVGPMQPISRFFKLIERQDGLFIDIRSHESNPPIYGRALVEMGPPFFCDEWGPTLIMKLGDEPALRRIMQLLSSDEMKSFFNFVQLVLDSLKNDFFVAHLESVLNAMGFSVRCEEAVEKFSQWASTKDYVTC